MFLTLPFFLVLEELMQQLASLNYIEKDDDNNEEKNSVADWALPLESRCQSLGAQCDYQGTFLPAQCDQDQCWCVDEAGNQLPQTNTFKKGEQLCCKC